MLVTLEASSTTVDPAPAPASVTAASGFRRDWPLVPITALALGVHLWALTSVGWGNAYYAAAARSMSLNWHNFLYASFDPAGFVAVDKPPFSLWVQALSVRAFGYSQLSLLLPQALAGTLAVALVYLGTRKLWGRAAGTFAAVALAITPINVVVNHSNNTDSVLVLLMTAGAVTALTAVRTGRLRWLVAAAALCGTAMTAKMLAAVPLMPAVIFAYLWCAPRRWTVRMGHSAVGLAVMATAGLWWFALVDLTPNDQRPYVGSSVTNSAFQLAFERNGVDQVEGTQGFGGTRGPAGRNLRPGARGPVAVGPVDAGPGGGGPVGVGPVGVGPVGVGPVGVGPGRGGPNGIPRLGFNGGAPGGLRLFNSELGTQIGWLIPIAVIGGLAAVALVGFRASARLGSLIVFGGWFAAGALVFSATKGIVHPYYLANIGPPVCGLLGAGVGAFGVATGRRRRTVVLLPVALATTAFAQWKLLARDDWSWWQPWTRWAALIAVGVAAVAGATMLLVRRRPKGPVFTPATVATALFAPALLAPALWTQAALAAPLNGPLPYAAPRNPTTIGAAPTGGLRPNGGFTFLGGDQQRLVAYLRANRESARWIVGVQSAAQAEAIIINFGEPVMAMGGFSGSDPILDEERLRAMIRAGEIRYFLVPIGGVGVGNGPGGGLGPALGGPGGGRQGGFGGVFPGSPGVGTPGRPRPGGPMTGPSLGGLLPGVPGGPQIGGQAAAGTPGFGAGGFATGPRAAGPNNGALTSLITNGCRAIPESEWTESTTTSSERSFPGGPSSASFTLYDSANLT